MFEFPAQSFVRFFHNHGFLNVDDRPQWFVVEGGSRSYVEALVAELPNGVQLRTPVTSVSRRPDGVELAIGRDGATRTERYDAVILATHSDTSLSLLSDPTQAELSVLGVIQYQRNDAILHLSLIHI